MLVKDGLAAKDIRSVGQVDWGDCSKMLDALKSMPVELRMRRKDGSYGRPAEIVDIQIREGSHPAGIVPLADCWVDFNFRREKGTPVIIPRQIFEHAFEPRRNLELESPRFVLFEAGARENILTLEYEHKACTHWFHLHF